MQDILMDQVNIILLGVKKTIATTSPGHSKVLSVPVVLP